MEANAKRIRQNAGGSHVNATGHGLALTVTPNWLVQRKGTQPQTVLHFS